MSPADAERLGLTDGAPARVPHRRGHAVAVGDVIQPGRASLPNGLGLDHRDDAVDGTGRVVAGVALNELTASEDRDPWAGTPWHKSVPARVEALS